jgi:hypothetical protein
MRIWNEACAAIIVMYHGFVFIDSETTFNVGIVDVGII